MSDFILGGSNRKKPPIQSRILTGPIYEFKNASSNGIEWTGKKRYNTVTGCNKISAGCKFCYAEELSEKLEKRGMPKYKNGFKLTLHPRVIDVPKKWKKPQIAFVNSMSDLFHKDVPMDHIKAVFEVMNSLPQHQFQILTKRGKRLKELAPHLTWTDNIWMGVSVEDKRVLHRVDNLRATPAKIKFISAEPLIGSLKGIDLTGIDWCIIGGESGTAKVRPMKLGWIEEVMEACDEYETRVFMKQMGRHLGQKLGMVGKKGGVDIHGKDTDKFPDFMKRWEFPIDIRSYLHCFEF